MSDPTLPQELALYDSMCRAIDAAYAVDEVKDIALAPARGELPPINSLAAIIKRAADARRMCHAAPAGVSVAAL